MRRIPFEVMVKGDKQPFYEETLEDAGRFTDQPILPFNAYGTMALARGEFEANSGSSQVFWLLKVSCCGTTLFSSPSHACLMAPQIADYHCQDAVHSRQTLSLCSHSTAASLYPQTSWLAHAVVACRSLS